MITCVLDGGIGNQMYMIAATAAHAMRNDFNYGIPTQSRSPHRWPTYFFNFPQVNQDENMFVDWPREVIDYNNVLVGYQQIPVRDNLRLNEHFQSYKYYDDCKEKIFPLFGFNYELKKDVVSVHVRAADYKNYPDKHPIIKEEYLKEAILKNLVRGFKKFLCFSDDYEYAKPLIDRCVESLIGVTEIEIEWSHEPDPKKTIEIMSCCENNICANSTLSLWAAEINPNKDKMIIIPKKWYGPGYSYISTGDMFRKEWIAI